MRMRESIFMRALCYNIFEISTLCASTSIYTKKKKSCCVIEFESEKQICDWIMHGRTLSSEMKFPVELEFTCLIWIHGWPMTPRLHLNIFKPWLWSTMQKNLSLQSDMLILHLNHFYFFFRVFVFFKNDYNLSGYFFLFLLLFLKSLWLEKGLKTQDLPKKVSELSLRYILTISLRN